MNKKSPKIRFKGFTDDWEQRKLEQLAQFNPKSSLPDKFEYVDLESVVGTEMISHRTETKENAPSRAQRLATQGDVFYQTVRPYQKNNYLFDLPHNNYVFSTGYAQLRPFGDSYFLLSRLQDDIFIFNVLQRSTGTSYPAINSSDLSQIEVGVPLVVEEQIKIGVFFKNLDHIIALHQDAIQHQQDLKKALLQKLFPVNGVRIPTVRFATFKKEWEQRKLGELASFSKGAGYTKGDLKTTGGKPIILYGRLYTKYETVIENVDTFVDEKEKSVISAGNEIIVPASGETSEDISRASVVAKPGIILGGDLNIVKPNTEIDASFLALTISNGRQQKELSKKAQGKSVVHLHNSDLKEVNLVFPHKEEQTKIGHFFRQLDATITLHQDAIHKLQLLKQSLLQKMFVN